MSYICMCVCMCACVCMCMHVCMCLCMYNYVYVYVCVCVPARDGCMDGWMGAKLFCFAVLRSIDYMHFNPFPCQLE